MGIQKVQYDHIIQLRKQRIDLDKMYNNHINKINKELQEAHKNLEKVRAELNI